MKRRGRGRPPTFDSITRLAVAAAVEYHHREPGVPLRGKDGDLRGNAYDLKRILRRGAYHIVASDTGNKIGAETVKKIHDKLLSQVRGLETPELLNLMRGFPFPIIDGDSLRPPPPPSPPPRVAGSCVSCTKCFSTELNRPCPDLPDIPVAFRFSPRIGRSVLV